MVFLASSGFAAEEEIGPQSFSELNTPIAGGEDVEILRAVEAAGTTAYFPEVQVRANVPEGWFTHNESVQSTGRIFVTKKRITGPRSKFRTGMTFYTHYELVMGREFADTASFTELMFPLLLKSAKRQQKKEREFVLETSLGTFRVLEALGRKKKANSIMWGAAQEAKGLFWFILEAPSEEWEESREQLLDLVRAVTLRSSGSPDDEIVVAAAHPWSKTYLLRTNRHKDELERRFKALRVGAPAAEYERIMGVQADPSSADLPEGWLNRFYTSKTYTDFVDVYGIYEGCIAFEMFSVAVTDGEITALRQFNRGAPADFDVESWDERIAGMKRDGPSFEEFYDSIRAWRTDSARVAAAIATAQTFSQGMDEQDYLNESGSFAIQFVPHQLRIVPGVLRIEGPDFTDDGVKTTYVYGTSKNSVDDIGGRIVVLNGKVESVQFELSDLP